MGFGQGLLTEEENGKKISQWCKSAWLKVWDEMEKEDNERGDAPLGGRHSRGRLNVPPLPYYPTQTLGFRRLQLCRA